MSQHGPHLFFDFDSTLIAKESLDEVIAYALDQHPDRARRKQQVAAITDRGMEGTLPFTESVRQRLAVVPLTCQHFVDVGNELTKHLTPGVEKLFVELAVHHSSIFIISGGFRDSILPVATLLGVPPERVITNTLQYTETGEVLSVDHDNVCFTDAGKASVIRSLIASHHLTGTTCMIGDGANDLAAYEAGVVDHFCAFTGNVERAVMRDRAPAIARSIPALRDFIFSLAAV
jgi:D-3-phosphoglycerate dehydrogenase